MLARAVLLLPLLALTAGAQSPAVNSVPPSNWDRVKMLPPGTEIRIDSATSKPGESKQIRGDLESVSDTELVLMRGKRPQSFPRTEIISVSVRKPGHRLRNAFIGLGAGAAVGFGVGYGAGSSQNSHCMSSGGYLCGWDEAAGTAAGGVIGIVGGTLVGVFWPTGGWRPIYAP